MELNFQVNYQVEQWGYSKKAALYEDYHKKISDPAASKSDMRWIKASGLIVGLRSALITLVMRVVKVFEDLIKGIANVLCSVVSKKFSAKVGLKQLKSFPVSLIKLLFSPLEVAAGTLMTTVSMAVSPSYYTNHRKMVHEKEALYVASRTNHITLSEQGYLILERLFSLNLHKEAPKLQSVFPENQSVQDLMRKRSDELLNEAQ